MHRYIWLVPLLPLLGAAVNGLLGRRFRFSERVIGAVGVGSVALAFLISVGAVISYGAGEHALWPKPYVTSEDGAFAYTWIPGGATAVTQGEGERAAAGLSAARGSVLDVEWSYQLDPLSAVFMLVVTGVGLCIFVFAP